jgi:prolyl oligopeptidase
MVTELDQPLSVVETLHGVAVADPYRWLEDRNLPETEHWIAKQRDRFGAYFQQQGPLEQLRQRVLDYIDVETVDGIGRVCERYFYRKRRARQQQPSIFVMESSTQTERLLVDPSSQGPYVSVNIHRVSRDGTLLAVEVKQGGEHTKAIQVVAVDGGVLLPDHLERGLACGFAFNNRNDGFYYCHDSQGASSTPVQDHMVRFHRFGTPSDNDLILLTLPRSHSSKLILSSAGEILSAALCHQHNGFAAVDYYVSRQDRDHDWHCICQNVGMPFIPFFYKERLFAHRFPGTSNGEIVELDATSGVTVRVIVPEWQVRINHRVNAQGRLYVSYLVGAEAVVRIWSFDGDYLGTLPLETGCTWRLLPTYADDAQELFLHCESFAKPPTLFRCDPHTNQIVAWCRRYSPPSTVAVTSRRLTYLSKDGTEIRMSLVGPHDSIAGPKEYPVIMTAYGGFGLTLTPQFSVFVSIMLELGFLFAVPEIRGGGERGRTWHEAARGRNRQVAFDDFIAAADWLCENGFTNPQKLAVFGGSNSGILVGAAITQRPRLFRAALCIAPLLDMLRYHLFDRASGWAGEYGTADDPEDFQALLAYSPYHHIDEHTNYPAVLLITGDRDSRCNPAHARKMAARLAERSVQSHPILLDHSVERGHAPTMPLDVRISALTHRIAFLCRELDIPIPKEIHNDMAGC